MNANELADEIEQLIEDDKPTSTEERWLRKIANFIRQQQTEIEALKSDLKYWTDPCDPLCKPSICDCYQARFVINNRKAQEK